jgi:anaerobic magnesium-protoporphyrin IX monomethyl ester cyclase
MDSRVDSVVDDEARNPQTRCVGRNTGCACPVSPHHPAHISTGPCDNIVHRRRPGRDICALRTSGRSHPFDHRDAYCKTCDIHRCDRVGCLDTSKIKIDLDGPISGVFLMDRVLLITPPYHCGVVESAGKWPNLGFIFIAGELRRAGFEVVIYDAMSRFDDYDDIRAKIEEVQPRFVGVTAITATLNDAVKVLALAKDIAPEIVTIAGGVHPTFCYEEILQQQGGVVDYCVIGEGEITAPELLTAITEDGPVADVAGIAYRDGDEVICTDPRPLIEDLDSLHPAWDLVDWNDYPLYFIEDAHVAILSSSRGCIYGCSFCSQHKFWGGSYRERDPVQFTDEIEHLYTTYGVNVFFVGDELPTRNAERWDRILDILIEKDLPVYLLIETHVGDILRDRDILSKYRHAGVLFIYVGVEAAEPGRLETFKKDISFEHSREAISLIKDAGMICETSLILGMPDETKETVEETLALAKLYNADYLHFLLIAPWPYADLYPDLKPFIEEYDYSKYNLVEPIIRPHNMTRQEVFESVLKCYQEYYMWKMPQWLGMDEKDFKRTCLLNGMKAIMENSFLKDHMSGLGEMPEEMRKLAASITEPR